MQARHQLRIGEQHFGQVVKCQRHATYRRLGPARA
jgi:hypothetical protein